MMKFVTLLVALSAVVTLASCGGGGSPGSDASAGGPSATPWVRYAGIWRGTRFDSTQPATPATLTLGPLSGQTGISANAVARVEAQLGGGAPLVLTAPNAADASGRPQYLFNFGQPAEAPNCTGLLPTLPVDITVTDVTGFASTKHIATCASTAELDFGAFSDYGTTSAQFSYSASAPITAVASRTSSTGYADQLVWTSQPSGTATLPSADGDVLVLSGIAAAMPTGTLVRERVDAGAGSYAESVIVSVPYAPGNAVGEPFMTLGCCGPRAASDSSVAVQLHTRAQVNGIPYPPDATYTYKFSITDPATGTLIGSQSDTIVGDAFFPLQVKRGQAIEMEVTPNDPRIAVSAAAKLGPLSGPDNVAVSSNKVGAPARFKVFCCSP
jgi:hypothetical protein